MVKESMLLQCMVFLGEAMEATFPAVAAPGSLGKDLGRLRGHSTPQQRLEISLATSDLLAGVGLVGRRRHRLSAYGDHLFLQK
eukprot:4669436-Lingulodinium_polyedra.AAC.1